MKKLILFVVLGSSGGGVLFSQVTNPTSSVSIAGAVTSVGNKSTNAAVPGASNLGVLPCVANAAAPTYTETFQVGCSTDLTGNTRVVAVGPAADGAAAAGNPVRVAAKDPSNNTQDILSSSGGTLVNAASSSDVDAISNAFGGTLVKETGGAAWLRTMPAIFNGSTWDRDYYCSNTAAVSVTAASTTEIIALTASQTIRICSGMLSISATGTATIVRGVGTNCGTSQANVTGAIALTGSQPITFNGGKSPILYGTSANAICITAVTGNVTGWFTYAKF